MKPKTVAGIVLIVFAAASLVYLVACQVFKGGPAPAPQAAPPTGPADGVVVSYLYGAPRCPTCMKIEAFSKEAVEQGFADAVAQGRVLWRAVNTDEPANKHFIDDYSLFAKAVVVSKRRGGQEVDWKNLQQVWDLTHDKEAFLKYVRDEVAAFLQ